VCSFTSTSSDPDGSIVSYSWTFGDGGTSNEQNPTHVYTATGSYTVTLTVMDNQGATASASHPVNVSAPPNQPPSVNAGPDEPAPMARSSPPPTQCRLAGHVLLGPRGMAPGLVYPSLASFTHLPSSFAISRARAARARRLRASSAPPPARRLPTASYPARSSTPTESRSRLASWRAPVRFTPAATTANSAGPMRPSASE